MIPLFKEFETQEEYKSAVESVMKNTPKKHRGELSLFIGRFSETLRQEFSQSTRKETK
tara:strand:- start:433 stop:606 length:174 start_codon:yes stop_codon:yes gene_type:complete